MALILAGHLVPGVTFLEQVSRERPLSIVCHHEGPGGAAAVPGRRAGGLCARAF